MAVHGEITTEARGSASIVHLKGEIDVSYLPELESNARPLLENASYTTIIFDCENLLFIDSKIVGFTAYMYTSLTKSGRRLVITHINETINDILTLVGLKALIPYYNTLEEALNNTLTPVAK
jgi:anti-anti-sigma factor